MKVTESGELVELVDVPEEVQQATQQAMSSFNFVPGNGFYFPFSEAKVGDSWQIPINMTTGMFTFTGTIDCAVTETGRITVPAGTYDAFKLELSSSDLFFALNPELEREMDWSMEIQMTMNGYEYFEKGTCRTIEAVLDLTMSMTSMDTTATMELSMEMQLTEHATPQQTSNRHQSRRELSLIYLLYIEFDQRSLQVSTNKELGQSFGNCYQLGLALI